MESFTTGLVPWLAGTTSIAIAATTVSIFFYFRNKKLRRDRIEWVIGKESDQSLDYTSFMKFFENYERLGGKKDDFFSFATNNFKKQIDSSKTLSHLETMFKDFHYGHSLIEEIHAKVKKENAEKVIAIVEDEWKNTIENKSVTIEALNAFQKRLKEHWCNEYELPEIFYERIKATRASIGKS